jgi:hypothetical protein
MNRTEELERIVGECYQVIASLAHLANVWYQPAVQRALDNAGRQRLVHDNVLPFILQEWPNGTEDSDDAK